MIALLAPVASAGLIVVMASWWHSRQPARELCTPGQAPPAEHAGWRQRLARRSTTVGAWWQRRRVERQRIGPSDVAAWVDDLTRSVRRGITLRQTIIDTRPDHDALAASTEPLRHRVQRGADVAAASSEWGSELTADHRVERHLRSTASVLSISSSVGGGAAAPLDRLAAALRQTAADESERGAQSAQALISARVLTCVPVAMLTLLLALDDDVRSVVRSPAGAAVVACGLVLNVLGGWWMRRIITSGGR
jgi:Flp pilus assembly protein TadB